MKQETGSKAGRLDTGGSADAVVLRVLGVLAGGALTTAAIGAALPDVSLSSLYRRLAAMRSGGLIRVVAERPSRGTVERTYALGRSRGRLTRKALAGLPKHRRRALVRAFAAQTAAELTAYAGRPAFDLPRDGGEIRTLALECGDAAFKRVMTAFSRAVAAAMRRPGRRPRPRTLLLAAVPHAPARAALSPRG